MSYNKIKHIIDFILALFAILISWPFWIIIAIGIKISSKGPVFYRATRSGVGFKTFTLYKFRSMHMYQPETPTSGEVREGGYIANPNRIFPFGSFLRKTKLDEIPQLINILKGDMSIVGPRPITEAGVIKHYKGKYDCVGTVRPGLACLDSLYDYAHGELFVKDDAIFDQKIAPVRDYLAWLYVKNMSMRLDLYCVFRTIYLIFVVGMLKRPELPYTKFENEAYNATVMLEVN